MRSGLPICHVSASGNWRGGGMSAGFPCGAPASTHFDDGGDFVVGERSIVAEVLDADVLVDEPRRHLARDDLLLDRPGPGPRLLVGQQRHRRDAARPMARLAVLLEDGRDVFREGDLAAGLAPTGPPSSGRGNRDDHASDTGRMNRIPLPPGKTGGPILPPAERKRSGVFAGSVGTGNEARSMAEAQTRRSYVPVYRKTSAVTSSR